MSIILLKTSNQLADTIKQAFSGTEDDIFHSTDYDKAIIEIQNNNIDVIISPYDSEDSHLSSFIKKVRAIKKSFSGIIMITSKENLKKIINERPDYDDIIIHPFTKEELLIRINKIKELAKLKSQSHLSKKNMLKLAKEDPHTGFFNRRSILDEALKEMNRSSRGANYLSAIMVNISNIKSLTDNENSEMINNLYLEFSRRLFRSCRPYDKIGRYGITEFLILLPEATAKQAEKVAKRLIAATSVKNININNIKFNIELDVGISQLDPDDVARSGNIDDTLINDLILDSLLKRTEIAMNNARKNGPNAIEIYSL